MKAVEQFFFSVVPFVMLYKVVLSFEFVDEMLKCDDSNKTGLLSVTFPWCCMQKSNPFENYVPV